MNTLNLSRRGFMGAILVGSIASLIPIEASIKNETGLTHEEFDRELLKYNRWYYAHVMRANLGMDDEFDEKMAEFVFCINSDFYDFKTVCYERLARIIRMKRELNISFAELIVRHRKAKSTFISEFNRDFRCYGRKSRAKLAELYYINNQPETIEDKKKLIFAQTGERYSSAQEPHLQLRSHELFWLDDVHGLDGME